MAPFAPLFALQASAHVSAACANGANQRLINASNPQAHFSRCRAVPQGPLFRIHMLFRSCVLVHKINKLHLVTWQQGQYRSPPCAQLGAQAETVIFSIEEQMNVHLGGLLLLPTIR